MFKWVDLSFVSVFNITIALDQEFNLKKHYIKLYNSLGEQILYSSLFVLIFLAHS